MAHILVVDDDWAICQAFRTWLEGDGHEVSIASSAEEGFEKAEARQPDLVFLDVLLPGASGIAALGRFKERWPDSPVVVMTGHGNMQTAVEAMRGGAFNYLTKPIKLEETRQLLVVALRAQKLAQSSAARTKEEAPRQWGITLIGDTPAMQEVYKKIGALASSEATVLITGESGTGKELVARAIHDYSSRADGPFVAVNCASLPETLLESELYGHVKGAFTGAFRDRRGRAEVADGGTLFLDEIGEIPPSIQAKLLRFLEQKSFERVGSTEPLTVNVRILAASNRDLKQRIGEGRFREDLYYRLNVISLHLPPLRERRSDIPALVRHFLARRSGRPSSEITPEALKALLAYDWPGNVRELENALEHALVIARDGPLLPEHWPASVTTASVPRPGGLEEAIGHRAAELLRQGADAGGLYERLIAEMEKPLLAAVLKQVGGNQVRAAKILGIHRTTLRKKIEEYGL